VFALKLSDLFAKTLPHGIVAELLRLLAIAGIFLYFSLRQLQKRKKDLIELEELRSSNAALRKDEQHLRDQIPETRMALEAAHAGAFSIELATGTVTWDDKLHSIYGLNPEEFAGRSEDWLEFLTPDDRSRAIAENYFGSAHGGESPKEFHIRRRNDGEVRWIESRAEVVFDHEKRPQRIVGIHTDITERMREKEEVRVLKEQLRQTQKMDAVGRLAAGVAHDFNNFLMVIRSYTELIEESLPAGDRLHKYAEEVLKASARAADLAAQLLAFSRKRVPKMAILNPHTVVNDATKMLKPLIGEVATVQILADGPIWPICADADQILQILMNLCVNARDAMPRGGTITIQIRNSVVGESGLADNLYVLPGAYVVLSVSDTGIGMSKKDMEHMFDPFFTTKPVGVGTGLGLSTVYGIVKQSNGYVWADSELGKGTRFNIYFPRADDRSLPTTTMRTEIAQFRGTETVLVVEDESAVREAICEFLRECGYTVLSASSGEQALLISGRYASTIDLLIADRVVSRTGGRELSQILTKLRPEVKLIFMSTNADRSGLGISERRHTQVFLRKPFSLPKLAQIIREILNTANASDSDSRSA
jgi:PAS domain S-box-containing protein